MPYIVFIHRGRNEKSDYLGGLLASDDFIFDYRGNSTIAMLWHAFLAAWRLPDSRVYCVEGALCLWPVLLYKAFHPGIRILMMIPEPAMNWRNRSAWKNRILSLLFDQVDYFLPISKLVAEDLRHYTDKPYSILHHYPSVDLEELRRIRPDYSAKRVLFMCRRPKETGWTKGLDIVFEIAKILLTRDPNFSIHLAGYGTEDLTNLPSNVVAEGDKKPVEMLSNCPYLLAPARYDAFPLAVVEACAAGCLPIISSTTGSEEFVKEIDPGLIINSFNARDYVSKIESLYNSSRAEINLRINGLRVKSSVFNKDRSYTELKSAIQKINSLLGLRILLK